jgi:class 3 adenylate cyclase
MQRKRVLVAFGDVRGFRKWTQRALNAPEIASDMIDRIYKHFESFAVDTRYWVKLLGDGIMIVQELHPSGHNCGLARRFLRDTHTLARSVSDEIQKVYPRPDGFRIRNTSGYVWKRPTVHQYKEKHSKHSEYIGYAVNLAQSLLYVLPEVEAVCHESLVEMIGDKRQGLTFEQLEPPTERRHGVDPADFLGLYRYAVVEKS